MIEELRKHKIYIDDIIDKFENEDEYLKCVRIYLADEFFDELKTAKNIFVYGAGAAAADVFDQLKSMHIKPVGVMVTKMKGNTSFFGDVPVKTLGEWGLVDDATVIIAVTGKYSNGIESMLRQKGYKRIIKVKETEC